MILLYHATGNQNVRAALRSLAQNNILHSFHTTIAVFKSKWYYSLLKGKLTILRKRTYPEISRRNTITYPFLEALMFLGIKKFGNILLTPSNIDRIIANRLAHRLDVMKTLPSMVYCYPGSANIIFKIAKKKGIKCIYELTTAYYKHILKLYEVEKRSNKDWYETITFYRTPDEELKKYDEELDNADIILCASSYIKSTLIEFGFNPDKIHIIKYGFPAVRQKNYRSNTSKLKLLYVGSIAQSKGVSYMFDAVDQLKDFVELSIVGTISNSNYKFIQERILSYNYLGTLSYEKVLDEMHDADLLILPTLSDGFGMVVSEAMSQGTPAIVTENSCASDIIQNGENGWIIPIQSTEAIFSILRDIIKDPDLLQRCGTNALLTAKNRPWSVYEKELSEYLSKS